MPIFIRRGAPFIQVDQIALRTGRNATSDPIDDLRPLEHWQFRSCLLGPRNQGYGERVMSNTALAAQS